MTKRDKLFAFIQAEAAEGRWPTRKAMAEHMGWKHAGGADDALWALVRRGLLTADESVKPVKFQVAA